MTLEEVIRLEYEIGRNNRPDFCIFLNGINDAVQGVFNGDPGNTIYQAEQSYTSTGILSTVKQAARVSVAAQTIYHSILTAQRKNDPSHTRSEAKVRELAEATAEHYERNLLRGKEICDQYGIRMIVFLQPHIYSITGRPWTPHEQGVADTERKGFAVALGACYPLLRQKLDRLRQRGILAYDISDAFDNNQQPIFLDYAHVESTGNGLLAEAVVKRALAVLEDPSLSRETAVSQAGPAN
jgi:hypothetical protein